MFANATAYQRVSNWLVHFCFDVSAKQALGTCYGNGSMNGSIDPILGIMWVELERKEIQ